MEQQEKQLTREQELIRRAEENPSNLNDDEIIELWAELVGCSYIDSNDLDTSEVAYLWYCDEFGEPD